MTTVAKLHEIAAMYTPEDVARQKELTRELVALIDKQLAAEMAMKALVPAPEVAPEPEFDINTVDIPEAARAIGRKAFELPADRSVTSLIRQLKITRAEEDLLFALIENDRLRDDVAAPLRDYEAEVVNLLLDEAEPVTKQEVTRILYWFAEILDRDGLTLDSDDVPLIRRTAQFIQQGLVEAPK